VELVSRRGLDHNIGGMALNIDESWFSFLILVTLCIFWLVALFFSVRLFRRCSRREKIASMALDVMVMIALFSDTIFLGCFLLAAAVCVISLLRGSPKELLAILALDSSLVFWFASVCKVNALGWLEPLQPIVSIVLAAAAVICFWLAYCDDKKVKPIA
jgi:hypothetical protein